MVGGLKILSAQWRCGKIDILELGRLLMQKLGHLRPALQERFRQSTMASLNEVLSVDIRSIETQASACQLEIDQKNSSREWMGFSRYHCGVGDCRRYPVSYSVYLAREEFTPYISCGGSCILASLSTLASSTSAVGCMDSCSWKGKA